MHNCQICNTNLSSIRKLSKHIRDNHKNISPQNYYDTFIRSENEDLCLICGSKTKYAGLNVGYKETCCKSCSSKLFRIRLKNDKNKYESFVYKIKESVKNQWETKDQSSRIQKMSETAKKKSKSMTPEERKQRYGFLNKLPEKEREELIKHMTENGFLKWWKNASYEQKRSAWDKRNEKLIKLWEQYGDMIHKKQKDTFAKRFANDETILHLSEKEMKKIFNNLDRIFNA